MAVETESSRPIGSVTGYIRDTGRGPVVRGLVRRGILWRGPVGGHLQVTVYATTGEALVCRAVRWTGGFGIGIGHAATYETYLGDIAPERLKSVKVRYIPTPYSEAARDCSGTPQRSALEPGEGGL